MAFFSFYSGIAGILCTVVLRFAFKKDAECFCRVESPRSLANGTALKVTRTTL